MLTLTPIVCVLASIVFSQSFDNFLTDGEPERIPLTSNQEPEVEDTPQASSGAKKVKKGKKKTEDKVSDTGRIPCGCIQCAVCVMCL